MSEYGKRMKQFMQGLDDTHIKIVYFDMNLEEIGKPYMVTDLKILIVHQTKFYINSGPRGQWTYTYKPSAMAYLFTRHDTKITAPFVGGDGNVIDIGNHFTVGLRENKKTKTNTITTHFTSYSEQDSSPLTFDVVRTPDCTLPLEGPITLGSMCANSVLVGRCYEKAPVLIEVAEELRKVFMGQHGQNGVKRYLSRPKKTLAGGGPQLTDEAIQMIYELIVQPVTEKYLEEGHQFVYTKLFYDTNNHFHARKQHVVFMYNILDHSTCAVFYVEVATILEAVKEYAYRKQMTCSKPSQKVARCYEELVSLPTIYLTTLWAI